MHSSKLALGDAAINRRPYGGGKGFPSGHTASATFGASSLVSACLKDAPLLKTAIVVAAGFTGASRIEAEKHTIWQVLGGVLLALFFERGLRPGSAVRTGARRGWQRVAPVRERLAQGLDGLLGRSNGRLRGCAGIAPLAAAMMLAPVAGFAGPWEVSVYAGYQNAHPSKVSGNDPGGAGAFEFTTEWDGASFGMPPYYGLRGTYWITETDGVSLEFTHAKIIADPTTAAANGFSHLEFTDGLNILTLNYMRLWPRDGRITPYGGVGAGLSIPYVEVTTAAGGIREYQHAGYAATGFLGARYALAANKSLFAEFKMTYSTNSTDLASGGTLDTDVVLRAINFGYNYRF